MSPESPIDISQWCLPPARQHAGTEAGLASATGANTPVNKTISIAMEMPRLMSRRILAHRLRL